ncbi:MAG: hypothetical protein OXT09_11550 [Myxococcales bacterium]|nr:hypothetical protein [Myxococcales bacterium]
MDILGIAVVIVLAIVAGRWLYARQPKQRERRELRELMLLCDGDSELAQRLVMRELERDEGLSTTEAARRARRRLARDRGR